MSEVESLIQELVDLGIDPIKAGGIVARAVACGGQKTETAEDRRRRVDRERQRRYRADPSRYGVTNRDSGVTAEPTKIVTLRDESVTNRDENPPLACVVDNNPFPKELDLRGSEAKASSLVILRSGFDDFWKSYPRKVAKADAREAYAKAVKLAPHDEIMAGLGRCAPCWTDPKFTPHPATWLNREGWHDELKVNENARHHSPKLDARNANMARAFFGFEAAAGPERDAGDGCDPRDRLLDLPAV